jgi:ribosomal-protein-alanine N-acetyltransferase
MTKTSRLLIQNWSYDDAEAFYKLSQDAGLTLFPINVYKQISEESALLWIKEKSKGKFKVTDLKSGELLGLGGLTPWILDEEPLTDMTYRLKTSAWGKGLGFELAQGLVDYGFNTLGLTQITATITPDNFASKKIAGKLGMNFSKHIELLGVPTDVYRLYKN